MENASNALLMAAEVMIALIIIAIAVYLIIGAKSLPENYEYKMSTQEVTKFNTEITKHIKNDIGEDYITPQDVVSIFKFKDEWEEKGVTITIIGVTDSEVENEGEFLKNLLPTYDEVTDTYEENIYKISIISYDSQGRINAIEFTKTEIEKNF